MKVLTSLLLGSMLLVATAAADSSGSSATEGQIVQRTPVRGGGNTIGEVRLVRRGDTVIVETVLRTALLRRVVGKIRDKELANWQPGRPGYEDALAYIKALEEAQSELARLARRRADSRDRTLKLLIEFSSSPSAVAVTLWDIDVEARGGVFRVTNRRRLRDVPVTRDYVDRNMRLILADSFGISEADAAALLAGSPAESSDERKGPESSHE